MEFPILFLFRCYLLYPPPLFLHQQLKRQFSDFIFPKLPGKWPFQLNDSQVDTRRRSLEDYLDKGEHACHMHACMPPSQACMSHAPVTLPLHTVCSARIIYESDLMQDFLKADAKAETNGKPSPAMPPQDRKVDLCIMLPNHSKCTVSIKENYRTGEVLEVSGFRGVSWSVIGGVC